MNLIEFHGGRMCMHRISQQGDRLCMCPTNVFTHINVREAYDALVATMFQ